MFLVELFSKVIAKITTISQIKTGTTKNSWGTEISFSTKKNSQY